MSVSTRAVHRSVLPSLALSAVVAGSLAAQQSRYELGLRVRDFERAFATKMSDVETRTRVLPLMQTAVRGFFTGSPGTVARALDEAKRVVLSDGVSSSPAAKLAASIECVLSTRCVDVGADGPAKLVVTQKPRYKNRGRAGTADKGGAPLLRSSWTLRDADGRALRKGRFERDEDGVARSVVDVSGCAEGDYVLRVAWRDSERDVARREMGVSVVKDARRRVDELRDAVRAMSPARSLEAASLAELTRALRVIVRGRSYESDLAACALLRDAEALRASLRAAAADPQGARRPWLHAGRSGDLRIGLPAGRATYPVRLFVPEKLETFDGPRPLVVAHAGAGGSANMWFEAYGAGSIVELCRKRSWFLAARASSGPDPAKHFVGLVDALCARLPVDRSRVFLVGHSMGAMRSCAVAARHPDRVAGVVALGGGGTVGRGDAFRRVPFFVAPGDRDFLLGQARGLARSLRAKGNRVDLKIYEACEHLGVVQVALPDAFQWLDALE